MRNLLTRVPKSAQGFVATMVRTIFAQPDAHSVREQHRRIVARTGFANGSRYRSQSWSSRIADAGLYW
jgi:transposase-like protein